MKHTTLAIALCAGLIPALLPAQETDALAEHISFYDSFDGALEPDQSRGSDKIVVGNLDKTKFRFLDGVKGQAVIPNGDKVPNLRFSVQDNIDFSVPGSVAFWFNPVDWVVQTPETPNQGKTQWKETYGSGFFLTAYSPKGYLVLQRRTSHVPNGQDALLFGFYCFEDIKKSNVGTTRDFPKGEWHFMVLSWDGLNYYVNINGEQLLSTSIPYKLTNDKLENEFELSMAPGLAYDELTVYDKQLSQEEIKALYERDNPKKQAVK